jgi:hypothetical protein
MDGLPHVGGGVSAITAPRPICRAAMPGMTRQALVRIVDAKIHTRPLCRARLFGVDDRNLAVVFRLYPFLDDKPQFLRRRRCFLHLDRDGSPA